MNAWFARVAVLLVAYGLAGAVPAQAQRGYAVFSGSTPTFLPGSPVAVQVVAQAAGDLEVSAFALSIDEALPIIRGNVTKAVVASATARKPVRIARAHIVPNERRDPVTVALGPMPPGAYLLRLRSEKLEATQVAYVSSLGLIASASDTGTSFWAVDLRTLRARNDVTFARYRGKQDDAPETRSPNAAGLVSFAPPPQSPETGTDVADVLVARAGDGSIAFALNGSRVTSPVSDEDGMVQTDRPLYRPGHGVHYRVILRGRKDGALTVPGGERRVRVRSNDGTVVLDVKRTLDTFGTLSGDVTLPNDGPLGSYQVLVGDADYPRVIGTFEVQAYVKPEFVIDASAPPFTVGGEPARIGVSARYLFGRPAAGLKLHYRAYFQTSYVWWRRGSPFRFAGYGGQTQTEPPSAEGSARADASGRATILIPTLRVDREHDLIVEIDGRDDAGRTVTTSARAPITPAALYLTVEPAKYFVTAGDEAVLAVRSRTYPNAAWPHIPVTVSFVRVSSINGETRREELRADDIGVVTGDDGRATVRRRISGTGFIEIAARAFDERGRPVTTTAYLWIADKNASARYTFLETVVVPQQSAFRPGERASLLVTVPQGGVDALVEIVSPTSRSIGIRRLETAVSTIVVDPPPGAARYRVEVSVPTPLGIRTGSAVLAVVPEPHRLTVAIRPDKARYEPGERARFSVRVGDANGQPVRAQVGLAVVDDAIFALRPDAAPNPFDVFYGSAGPYVSYQSSWSALGTPAFVYLYNPPLQMIGRTNGRSETSLLRPGVMADTYSIGARLAAPPPSFEKLRSDFRDTAFWSPSVITGNDGRAIVTFDWPDSLTSFTARGLAVTAQSDMGAGTGSALVTKDFLVRLSTSRFLRSGDTAQFTGIAQGTPSAKRALLRFSAPELGIADTTAAVGFDRAASASARWNVRARALGDASLRLAGSSGTLRDGLRVTLPVESAGTADHVRAAGSLPNGTSTVLRLPAGAQSGDLRVELAPSLVAQMLAGVRLLEIYPYYCTEQTMSAALPAIQVDRLRKHMQLADPGGTPPAEIAKKAVARLAQLQHGDGSWGWWEHDDANPFMTAYAMYGLTELARDGYTVPDAVRERGIASLQRQLGARGDTLAFWGGTQQGSEWNTRAYMLFALADARPAAVDRAVLAQTDARASDMNSYAVAALGLAHVALGDRAGAQPLLDELLRRVSDDGTYASWKGAGWHYRWQDDPIETTAYALRFLHAMTPDDPRVVRVVSWLRAQSHGSWFETTKDTAAAIGAISETIAPSSDELTPHETVRVQLDGRTIKTLRIDAALLARGDASITVPGRAVRNGSVLRFERTGSGALYWSTDWTRYLRGAGPGSADAPFSVKRLFSSPNGNDWRVGDVIDVDTTIEAISESQYVAIEDPLPAGLEFQPKQHETGDDWSGLQFFDDRVVFFATTISPNQAIHLHYQLRATTAGTFAAPPTTAYAMYGPPATSAGQAAKITIR